MQLLTQHKGIVNEFGNKLYINDKALKWWPSFCKRSWLTLMDGEWSVEQLLEWWIHKMAAMEVWSHFLLSSWCHCLYNKSICLSPLHMNIFLEWNPVFLVACWAVMPVRRGAHLQLRTFPSCHFEMCLLSWCILLPTMSSFQSVPPELALCSLMSISWHTSFRSLKLDVQTIASNTDPLFQDIFHFPWQRRVFSLCKSIIHYRKSKFA